MSPKLIEWLKQESKLRVPYSRAPARTFAEVGFEAGLFGVRLIENYYELVRVTHRDPEEAIRYALSGVEDGRTRCYATQLNAARAALARHREREAELVATVGAFEALCPK